MEDYYRLLGLERTASPEEIQKQLKSETRTWSRRVNSPDLSRRQEAERLVAVLTEAYETLLDPARRAEYDRKLAEQPATPAPTPDKAPGANWLEETYRHLEARDYHSAAYAGRQARDADPGNPACWLALALASASLNNVRDAVFEADKVVALAPNDAHFQMRGAAVYTHVGRWAQAQAAYERALQLDPSLEEAKLGLASALLNTNRSMDALWMLEQVYATTHDKVEVGNELGFSLLVAAESAPRFKVLSRSGEVHLITSPNEITTMYTYITRARQVTRDFQLLEWAAMIEQRLIWCSTKHLHRAGWTQSGCLVLIVLAAGGMGLLTCFISLLALKPAGLLVGLVFLGPPAAAIFFSCYLAGWQINAKTYRIPIAPGPRWN